MPRVIWCAVLVIFFSSFSFGRSKDTIQVDVKAVHQVTHEARDTRALVGKGLMGSGAPNRSVEVYDIDSIINDERVKLSCIDSKGCEAPSIGTYSAETRHDRVKITFDLPLSHKSVTRLYKISGSW